MSVIISAIVFKGHTLTLGGIISLAVFLGIVIAVYAGETYLIINALKSRRKGQGIPKQFWSKRAIVIHLSVITGVICLLYGHFIEPTWLEIKHVDIITPKLHNAALRLVQISDTHCTLVNINEKKAVNIINGLKPDVIVFTGDAANNSTGLKRFKKMLEQLEAALGKIAIRGNVDTDRWAGTDIFNGTGFIEIDGNSVEIKKDGDTLWVTGVTCEKEAGISDVLKQIPDNSFSVFLHHFPDLTEDLAEQNIDLYLAGHTHGGQIALPYYGAVITLSKFGKKYESGEYRAGRFILYVNRGMGLAAGINPKMRFFARPEITVFDIKPK